MEERPVGRPAVGVCQTRRHQPRLPQDTCRRYVSCRQTDVIGDEFGKLEQVAAAGGYTHVQEHLSYIRHNWVDGCWRPATWSAFRQPVSTNNDVEGWHYRLNAKASHGRLNLYQLLQLLHDEARLVTLAVCLLSDCGTSRMQRKSYVQLHSRIFQLWNEYSDGSRSAVVVFSHYLQSRSRSLYVVVRPSVCRL